MAECSSFSVADLVSEIREGKFILPAMQRSFVWPEDKICGLFDSLMRDYPIGTFLFWKIKRDVFNEFIFNEFLKVYDESKQKDSRGERAVSDLSEYCAVLDGQQRITSLYLGVAGKWITRRRGKKKGNECYNRFLCIDLLSVPKDDEPYPFKFVEEAKINKVLKNDDGSTSFWLKVSEVLPFDFVPSRYMLRFNAANPGLLTPDMLEGPAQMLDLLHAALTNTTTINYFLAKDKSLPQVAEIFVRVNSGGQKLAASDLMLSVASGNLDGRDVHSEMKLAIENVEAAAKDGIGFKADQDLLLTTGLLFTNAPSLSMKMKKNYSRDRMRLIFNIWDDVVKSLCLTVRYIEHIGFAGKKLSSKNLILPIAYYLYDKKKMKHPSRLFGETDDAKCDKIFIRQWMLRSMLNDVFSDGTGATLIQIKEIISKSKSGYFPLKELMDAEVKRSLVLTDETFNELCNLKYGDVKVFPVLEEIAGYARSHEYHIDHMWAQDQMTRTAILDNFSEAKEKDILFFENHCHSIANLELMPQSLNSIKNNVLYDEWLVKEPPLDSYYEANCVPKGISYAFSNFENFFKERQKLIRSRLEKAFPAKFADIVSQRGLKYLNKNNADSHRQVNPI